LIFLQFKILSFKLPPLFGSFEGIKASRTLSAIFRSPWLIDHQAANSYMPLVSMMVQGTVERDPDKEPEDFAILQIPGKANEGNKAYRVYGPYTTNKLLNEDIEDATVVFSIQDAITKHDGWCSFGSMTMAEMVNKLSASDKVSTLILEIDSPGGMVDGTQTLANAIANSAKKTIAFINEGMAASAAYWIASSCDEIYVSQKTDTVGSIGVYLTIADFKGYFEKQGLKVHEIYSRLSGEKNKDYKDALEGDYSGYQDKLDFIAKEFIAHVKANRTIDTSAADPFKGAMFYAEQAIEIGLIDGIKSFDELITYVGSATKQTHEYNAIEMKISHQLAVLLNADATNEEKEAARAAVQGFFDADEVFTQEEVDAAVTEATTPLTTEIANLKTQIEDLQKPAEEETEVDEEEEAQFGGKKEFKNVINP
jgi:protease-4